MDLTSFIKLAAFSQPEHPVVLTFPSPHLAVSFRLRLYKEKLKGDNKYLPAITILLNDCTLTAGPRGFDLIMQMDEETKRRMEELEKQEKEEFYRMEEGREREKERKAVTSGASNILGSPMGQEMLDKLMGKKEKETSSINEQVDNKADDEQSDETGNFHGIDPFSIDPSKD